MIIAVDYKNTKGDASFSNILNLYSFFFCSQVERVVTIMQNPRQYKIPDWFLNRQKDIRDGKYSQVKKKKKKRIALKCCLLVCQKLMQESI